MHLSSILKEYKIDINKTKLVRHTFTNEDVKKIYKSGMFEIYQSLQSKNRFDGCKYIVSFIGKSKTEALFIGVYEIIEIITGSRVAEMLPIGYPEKLKTNVNYKYYKMKKLDIMADLENKLVIEWGNSPLNWHQWAINDKEVISISNRTEEVFPGYERLIVPYLELGFIINEDSRYSKWVDALKNVNCIYLIVDTKYNKQYIGSTYNKNGIFGRWKDYYEKKHGDDDLIKKHLKEHPDAYNWFQFTILKVLPLEITSNEATEIERFYKKKFNTLYSKNPIYGLNGNL